MTDYCLILPDADLNLNKGTKPPIVKLNWQHYIDSKQLPIFHWIYIKIRMTPLYPIHINY